MNARTWGTILLIIGVTLCNLGIWELVKPAQYRAIAQLNVGPIGTPVDQVLKGLFGFIRSPFILEGAIKSMGFTTNWDAQHTNSKMISTNEALALLNRNLELRPATNVDAGFIEICYVSQDAIQAANMANAVADAYRQFHLKEQRVRNLPDTWRMQEQRDRMEVEIQRMQKRIEELRKQLDAPQSNLNRTTPTPYVDVHSQEESELKKRIDFLQARRAKSQRV